MRTRRSGAAMAAELRGIDEQIADARSWMAIDASRAAGVIAGETPGALAVPIASARLYWRAIGRWYRRALDLHERRERLLRAARP